MEIIKIIIIISSFLSSSAFAYLNYNFKMYNLYRNLVPPTDSYACRYFSIYPNENDKTHVFIISAGHCSNSNGDETINEDTMNAKVKIESRDNIENSYYTVMPSIKSKMRMNDNDWDIIISKAWAKENFSKEHKNIIPLLLTKSDDVPLNLTFINKYGTETMITNISKYSESSFSGMSGVLIESGDSGSPVFDKKSGIVYGVLSGSFAKDGKSFGVFNKLNIRACFDNGEFNFENEKCPLPRP